MANEIFGNIKYLKTWIMKVAKEEVRKWPSDSRDGVACTYKYKVGCLGCNEHF